MAKVWTEGVCNCGSTFRTSNDSEKCYWCHLHRISGGIAPEEGDFNSAHLAAGDMTEKQEREFQLELQNVELGLPSDYRGPVPYNPEEDEYAKEYDWYDEED